MEKTFLGAEILRRLGYIKEGVAKFLDGVTMYSEEPMGILFDLSEKMKTTVAELENKGYVVYAVIQGAYQMPDSIMRAATYLCLQ